MANISAQTATESSAIIDGETSPSGRDMIHSPLPRRA
jgi:hypothetical protein